MYFKIEQQEKISIQLHFIDELWYYHLVPENWWRVPVVI
jgi:hypothetical protein